jgi:hypothetical protein
MKQLTISLTIAIAFIFSTLCAIAQPQFKTTIPNEVHLLQNPFMPMNILLIPDKIEGVTAQAGDLVMAFDGEVCVGAVIVEDIDEILNLVATSTDEVNKGFKSGQTIRLEYHSIYDNAVYELIPKNIIMGSMNYEALGTLYAEFKANALSIEESNNTHEIKVYPNPVSQQLHIVLELNNTQPGERINLKLINIAGKVVIAREFNANQPVINLSVADLPSGEYTFLLTNANIRFTQKVIKK